MKIRNRFVIRSLTRVASFFLRILYATCRRDLLEAVPDIAPYKKLKKKFIYCGYHDNILTSLFVGKVIGSAALTSRHADGDIIAEILNVVGIKPIRGSHNHGGAAAGKQLIDTLEQYHIYITTDGPRGPRRVVKPGVVFIASVTGAEIIPVASTATRCWKPRGKWTELMIPKPFSHSLTILGEPFSVPPGLTKEQLTPYVERLQVIMDTIHDQVERLARGEAVPEAPPFPDQRFFSKAA